MNCKKIARQMFALLACLCLMASAAVPAFAEGTLELSTPYSGVNAKAGEMLTFPLDLKNAGESGCNVSLSASAPKGFTGYFEGDDRQITAVFAKAGDNNEIADYTVTVPNDASAGTHTVTLKATSGENSSSLTLKINVVAAEAGSTDWQVLQTDLEGAVDSEFSFSTTLENGTPGEQTYGLTADLPTGWTASFTADDAQVAAVTLKSHAKQTVVIVVTPPENVQSGKYEIPVTATSSADTVQKNLSVTITGQYAIQVSTPDGLLSFDAVGGKTTPVTVKVTNTGNVQLQKVWMSSSTPTGWTVEFSLTGIETIDPGQSVELTAYVTPSDDAMSGDYSLQIKGQCTTCIHTEDFRVTVKTQTVWGVVGAVIILAALAVLAFLFRKFGRR